MIERAVNLTPGRIIDIDNLHFEVDNELILPDAEDKSLKAMVEQLESKVITEALSKHGSIRKTSQALGLSHPALLKR